MNAVQPSSSTSLGPEYSGRMAFLQRFNAEDIQHMGQGDLQLAQSIAGHGKNWGIWETPEEISPGKLGYFYRAINIRERLRAYLSRTSVSAAQIENLIEEGVHVITRLAMVTRLIATGGRDRGRTRRLKPSSITVGVYSHWPEIVARAIVRKNAAPDAEGLLACLTEADVEFLNGKKRTRIELTRFDTLVFRGAWTDVPKKHDIRHTTDPSGEPATAKSEVNSTPFSPLPDKYMAEIGPRLLWVVQQMGPCLIELLEDLRDWLPSISPSVPSNTVTRLVPLWVEKYMAENPWVDERGAPIVPPFSLTTSKSHKGATSDAYTWPPLNWAHINMLSQTLQAAQIFITLLACSARSGEVETLKRNCIAVRNDGNSYIRGYTYKFSGSLFGDAREWPAPEILAQCLGQQSRLASAWDWMPSNGILPTIPRYGDALWITVGTNGRTGLEGAKLNVNVALHSLAIRIGMTPTPGGRNLHAHRLRKTIGRLAGIALFNSPLVLKRLFGHKNIEMTLHYILSDPSVREEAEKVLRELRIMHCAETLEEIQSAIQSGQPLPGNGGKGAARLVTAVANETQRIAQSGAVWSEGSAYDLAFLLTAQGISWRLIKENIVCSKAPGEEGLCRDNRALGEPNTANCKQECSNRIVLSRRRRDVELILAQYVAIAREARQDGQLLVLAGVMQNLKYELGEFADLGEKYLADPEVQSLFSLSAEIFKEEGQNR